jgi:hypothetical protein
VDEKLGLIAKSPSFGILIGNLFILLPSGNWSRGLKKQAKYRANPILKDQRLQT